MAPPFKVDWKLKALLDREGVTVYALAKKLGESTDEPLHITTLYRWANQVPSNPGLEGIGWVLWGLSEITGKTYEISDVLEYRDVTQTNS